MNNNMTFLQIIKIMNKVYKTVLFCLITLGIILFLKGYRTVGFIISLICVFDFGRRLGFDKGYLMGYGNGRKSIS